MTGRKKDFQSAANDDKRKFFNAAFDRLIAKIGFPSEKIAILPENVEKTRTAYVEFLREMKWPLAEISFEELLKEKSGEHEFRHDGKTPNWYHEFREILPFLASVRADLLKAEDFTALGGIETEVAIITRHDSWEDLGVDRKAIRAQVEARYPVLNDIERFHISNHQMEHYLEGIDLLTRKEPVRGEDGAFERKANGKYRKVDRFGGQDNIYYTHVLRYPTTILAKFYDGCEGMSTRNEAGFNPEDNNNYTRERRMLFGTRALDVEAKQRFPFLKDAIESADGMLGILLMAQETVNNYDTREEQNPEHQPPIAIDHYLTHATKGFKHLPRAWHPVAIFIERLETKAAQEFMLKGESRTATLLCRAFYPALNGRFDIPQSYNCLPPANETDFSPQFHIG